MAGIASTWSCPCGCSRALPPAAADPIRVPAVSRSPPPGPRASDSGGYRPRSRAVPLRLRGSSPARILATQPGRRPLTPGGPRAGGASRRPYRLSTSRPSASGAPPRRAYRARTGRRRGRTAPPGDEAFEPRTGRSLSGGTMAGRARATAGQAPSDGAPRGPVNVEPRQTGGVAARGTPGSRRSPPCGCHGSRKPAWTGPGQGPGAGAASAAS